LQSRALAAGAVCLALAACVGGGEIAGDVGLRDRAVPISSTMRGDASRLVGDWIVEQSLANGGAVQAGTPVSISADRSGGLTWRIGAARFATVSPVAGRYAGDGVELWLLWIDADYRTAVIGTPDGRLGWIMNRPGAASADRTTAARRILDFNGYDPADFAG